jgi:ubiquinone/menaquinone biosynthesis C-methylase UbiE
MKAVFPQMLAIAYAFNMNQNLTSKLKHDLVLQGPNMADDIAMLVNPIYLTGDNQKYSRMYDRMAPGYDFAEQVIGKIKYGNSIKETRKAIISQLEWQNGASVLYVSIGTGTDLHYIPAGIDSKSLDIVGADISLGMLKRCQKKYREKFTLSLVNCCAEDLPFNDNQFDIVFHIGGINFFNDKARAIREMIRVAKKGTKILVADETDEFVQKQYKKTKSFRPSLPAYRSFRPPCCGTTSFIALHSENELLPYLKQWMIGSFTLCKERNVDACTAL